MRNLRIETYCNQQKPILFLFLNIERIIVLEVNQMHILSTSTLPKTIIIDGYWHYSVFSVVLLNVAEMESTLRSDIAWGGDDNQRQKLGMEPGRGDEWLKMGLTNSVKRALP